MPPPSNKTNTAHVATPIILGIESGVTASPDMKIKVFEAEFHVHSQVLKIYSHHFNAFIDHPSKAPRPDVPSGSFKYEWITVVDEEGKSWYSADASEFTDGIPDTTKFKGNKTEEAKAFENLLAAIYGESYHLNTVFELERLTALGDYYLALPVVSRSLDGLFHRCPNLMALVETASLKLLPLAAKLQHPVLFKECVLFLAAPHDKPLFDKLEDSQLRQVVATAHQSLVKRVSDLLWLIFQESLSVPYNNLLASMARSYLGNMNFANQRGVVEFLRSLNYKLGITNFNFSTELDSLLSNKSVFRKDLSVCASKSLTVVYQNRHIFNLYCTELKDEDLPWVSKQKAQ